MYFHSIIVHSRSETLETSRSFQTIYIYSTWSSTWSNARGMTITFSGQYFYFKRIIRRSVMRKIMCRTRISSRAYYDFPILSGREEDIRGTESVCAHAERVDGWARWNRREQIDGKGWKSAKRPREKDTKQLY